MKEGRIKKESKTKGSKGRERNESERRKEIEEKKRKDGWMERKEVEKRIKGQK